MLLALYARADRHLTADGRHMVLVDRDSGAEVEPVLVDRASGRRLTDIDAVFTAGPDAGPEMRARFAEPPPTAG